MTSDEAVAWWYGRIDFERRAPLPDDLKLDRMRALLQALGDPHHRLRIVHIAGTKGKGSTAAMIASVLRSAGYRVGLFTSPHLCDVAERIQIDGVPISREEIAARITEIATAAHSLDSIPTFFEVGTALGFLHFDCRHVDVAVIEVGLGGRFDSTNVCTPRVTVITNISFDHMALLGDRLSQIAREKAGIIKRGVPVVTTAESPEALEVIERIARDKRAPMTALGSHFHYEYQAGKLGKTPSVPIQLPRVRVKTARQCWPWMNLGLFGQHQAANAAGAVAVVEQLRHTGLFIDDASVAHGLAHAVWPARLEVIATRPLMLLDCAHNVASAEALVATIRDSFAVAGQKHLIFAISSDKQVAEMLAVLEPFFDHFYLTRYANNPRCLAPERVEAILRATTPTASATLYPTAEAALSAAKASAGPDDLIAITGSVFLAGELRSRLIR